MQDGDHYLHVTMNKLGSLPLNELLKVTHLWSSWKRIQPLNLPIPKLWALFRTPHYFIYLLKKYLLIAHYLIGYLMNCCGKQVHRLRVWKYEFSKNCTMKRKGCSPANSRATTTSPFQNTSKWQLSFTCGYSLSKTVCDNCLGVSKIGRSLWTLVRERKPLILSREGEMDLSVLRWQTSKRLFEKNTGDIYSKGLQCLSGKTLGTCRLLETSTFFL